jgi:hypothetical protein
MLSKTLELLEKELSKETISNDPERLYDDSELRDLAQVLRQLLYAPYPIRDFLQREGVNVSPSNYYSEIPSIEEIQSTFEQPAKLYCQNLFSKVALDKYLQSLLPYSVEFNPPKILDGESSQFAWSNKMFSYSDAMAYYSFIRHSKPNQIIEIGSGYSSLVALEALSKNGIGKLTSIEPYPSNFLEKNNDICLIRKKAQEIEVQHLNDTLENGDILFIDSTHTVKHGSDCVHIYLNLLPQIKHDIYIHVHDIFLPFTFPRSFLLDHQIYWTEQYLLGAYLLDNPKIEILYSSAFSERNSKDLLDAFMHKRWGCGGSSLWFKYKGSL